MKKLLFFVLFVFCTITVSAQKITKNEVDKFTKSQVVETSMESLYSVNLLGTGYCNKFEFCIRKTDTIYTMPANILMKEIVKYTENDGVTFLLDNDDVVSLKTNFTGIGGESWAKGYWFRTSFTLSESDVNKLKEHKVTAIRINYLDGHYDKELKGKKQELIRNSILLIEK